MCDGGRLGRESVCGGKVKCVDEARVICESGWLSCTVKCVYEGGGVKVGRE